MPRLFLTGKTSFHKKIKLMVNYASQVLHSTFVYVISTKTSEIILIG